MRNPFIVGSWVRGERFFGRTLLLAEIMEGHQDAIWVVGSRRIGKTSLLRETERRAQQNPHSPFIPLYWDLQGSGDARGLADDLVSSLEDSESFRRAIDLSLDELDALSVCDMLATLIRRTVRSGWRLLLLVDEAEELLTIARSDPAILPRLRRIFQKGPEVRTILTATKRLARIGEQADFSTSPFLHGFEPPLYLANLSRDEAQALLALGEFSEAECALILEQTGCHPFLLQLVASRAFENRDLEGTLAQVAGDEMVANYFALDTAALESHERAALLAIAQAGGLTAKDGARILSLGEEQALSTLTTLVAMGYLVSDQGGFALTGGLFRRWLRRSAAVEAAQAR